MSHGRVINHAMIAGMFEVLLAHIGIPLLAGLVLLFMIAATDKEPISWKSCNDIALDLTILSAGACGGIFANPTLLRNLGDQSAIYGIVLVLLDLFCAGILIYFRRWQVGSATALSAIRDLFFGGLTVGLTVSFLCYGLRK